MRVLLSGGGTGGHVYPMISVVSAMRRQAPPRRAGDQSSAGPDSLPAFGEYSRSDDHPQHGSGQRSPARGPADARPTAQPKSRLATAPENDSAVALCYVGQSGNIEEELARLAGIPFRSIESGQIRGRAPWEILRSLRQMASGAKQCAEVIREFKPDVALVTGGYVAAPVAWAAWRARPRVPLLIFLPDLTPGLSIRLTSMLAAEVAVSFAEAADYFPGKAVVTGYPVRPELMAANRLKARRAFGLRDDLRTLLVFGGSRGSRSINRALVSALTQLLEQCQVIHISGQADWAWVAERFGLSGSGVAIGAERSASSGSSGHAGATYPLATAYLERYHPFPYLREEMVDALTAADLVVARAGASVLGEFPAVGLPSILVPYPHAGQHQGVNAAYLARHGAAQIVKDEELSDRLAPTILDLLNSPDRLYAMSQAAASLARPDAAANIVRELRRLAGPRSEERLC
jgi:UDP-N-acetylglucosamine--N-acetylmuramyl-(pentapeptide) pyrophosphoryl-undecaprenol N-acetylglucosamine transferase